MALVNVEVPDIGDFKDVAVIELLVKPGDRVQAEQSLVTVESDKASMEIPSSHAGVVKELKVKLGDKVSRGSALAVVDSTAGAAPSPPAVAAGSPPPQPSPSRGREEPFPAAPAASHVGAADIECDMLVLGAGPGGYSAAFRAADLGMKVVLVERYATLGGVCLNVGCIPSKALLHVAAVMDEVSHFDALGVSFGKPAIDLAKLRAHKDKVVGKLTGGLTAMAKMRKVTVVRGVGAFLDPHHVQVEETGGAGQEKTGRKQTVRFRNCIIAAGSRALQLPFMPQDPRVVDSTGALALSAVPKRMLVLGGGIIGLEMGTVYSTLGARLDVVEMLDGLMPGADRDLVRVWQRMNAPRFDKIMLKTKTVAAEATANGILVRFEGEQAPKEPQLYDLVLQAVGRSPNGKQIGAERAGVTVSDRGFIPVDIQMRTNVPHIFAIGDIVGQPMLAHKAVHEGHVAAEAAAGEKSAFDARVIPERRLHRPGDCLGRLDRRPGQGAGHCHHQGALSVERVGTGDRQQPRRRIHEALVRCAEPSHRGRRNRRHACRRPDRRGGAGDRDGCGRAGHRQDDPSPSDAGRKHGDGCRSSARDLYGSAAATQESGGMSPSRRPLRAAAAIGMGSRPAPG